MFVIFHLGSFGAFFVQMIQIVKTLFKLIFLLPRKMKCQFCTKNRHFRGHSDLLQPE